MKTCYYKFGTHKCHAYWKTAGHGYEVAFYFGDKCVFMGNFVHRAEAAKWWTKMNKELKTFGKRYGVGPNASYTWYAKFCSNHLYKCYYGFLDTQFAKYQRTYTTAVKRDTRKHNTMKKRADHWETYGFRKTA